MHVAYSNHRIDRLHRVRPEMTSNETLKKKKKKAVDACKKSYEAADENKSKADVGTFNDIGLMALVCRHDIPLFFANIDTPGEQQKYAVALLEHIFTLLPASATVVAY